MKVRNLCAAILPAAALLAGGAVHAGSIGDALGIGGMNPIGKPNAASGASSALIGNPSSAAATGVDNAFAGALTVVSDRGVKAEVKAEKSAWMSGVVGLAISGSQFRSEGITSKVYSLPLSYSVRPELDPRRVLTLRLPITVTSNPQGDHTHVGLGLDYRFPINDEWSITPSFLYTRVESDEYGKGKSGDLYNSGLTSVYNLDMDAGTLSIGNMIGYISTSGMDATMTDGRTTQKNWVTRNGLMYTNPVTIGEKPLGLQASLINTHYWGDEIYNKDYNEVGVTLGTDRSGMSSRSYMRAGVSYLFSSKSEGVSVKFGYWF